MTEREVDNVKPAQGSPGDYARRITRSGGYDGANPLDITLENNGGGVAQVLVSAQGDGVLGEVAVGHVGS